MLMSSWRLKRGALGGGRLGGERNEVVGPNLLSHPHSWEFQLSLDLSESLDLSHAGPVGGKGQLYWPEDWGL